MAETKKKAKTRKKAPAPKGGGKKTCSVTGCQRAYRAKGLCFFHYKKWRRGELQDRPSRFKTCSMPDCDKKVVAHGLCQEHHDAWKRARLSAKLSGASAAPAEPAAEAKPAEAPAAS